MDAREAVRRHRCAARGDDVRAWRRAFPWLTIRKHLDRWPHLQHRIRVGRHELATAQLVDHQSQVEAIRLEQPLEALVELERGQVIRDRQIVEGVADDQVVLAAVALQELIDHQPPVHVVGRDVCPGTFDT